MKVAQAKQTAFPLVSHAAAVTLCTGRFSAASDSVIRPIVRALAAGPSAVHTTVLIRLIGLDLELPAEPVPPDPVTCGTCGGCPGCWGG